MQIFRRALFGFLVAGVALYPATQLFGWFFVQALILVFAIPGLLIWLAVFLKSEPVLTRVGLVILILIYLFAVYVAGAASIRT